MSFNINSVRHPREKTYGRAMLVVGLILWLLIALFVVLSGIWTALFFGLYVLLIWGFYTLAQALMRAYMFGHYVMVGPNQFPHIHAMVEEGARRVGLKETPATFVYNSNGVMNAFALTLIGRRRYVWLTSALIDADNEEQLRFVIGHELGHHVAGHLDDLPNIIRYPAMLVPFLGSAYSRSRELTCDRVGGFLVRDADVARSALQMLACGSAKLNAHMNSRAFAEQEKLVPPIAGFFLMIFSTYPRLTERVDEVAKWLGTTGRVQLA